MYNNTTLGQLIAWLETQPPDMVVPDGFGSPHSDRGSYDELAFKPMEQARIGDMLNHARSAVGATFTGYKGGEYKMDASTPVYIGFWSDCGTPITPTHFKYWALIGEAQTALAAAIQEAVAKERERCRREEVEPLIDFADMVLNAAFFRLDDRATQDILYTSGKKALAAVRAAQQTPAEGKEQKSAFFENPVKDCKLTLLKPQQQAGKETKL